MAISWRSRGIVIVLLALGLLAVPAVGLSVQDPSTVYLHVEGYSGTPPSAQTVVYTDLNENAKTVFDRGRTETLGSVNANRYSAALQTFSDTPFVTYAGGSHRIRLYYQPSVFTGTGITTVLLLLLGGLLLTYGPLVGLARTWRPYTAPRSLAVPLLGLIALFAVPTDVTGGTTALSAPLLVTFPPMVTLFVCGCFAKGGYLKSMLAIVGTGGLALVVGLLLTGQPLILALGLGSVVLLGGIPWFVLGYFLTAHGA
jgi:hypothetical protein